MADKPFDKNHLFLVRKPAAKPFTAPSAGGGGTKRKSHDPASHGARLRKQYLAAIHDADVADKDLPVRVEFESEPDFALAIDSLENAQGKRPIELLAVRQEGSRTFATVQVPRERLQHFTKLFERYSTEKTEKGEPKKAALVDSIARVRRAVFESLWTDLGPPPARDQLDWFEVWLRGGAPALESFRSKAGTRKLPVAPQFLPNLDRIITLVRATPAQLEAMIEEDDTIAEVRHASLLATDFLDLNLSDRAAWGGTWGPAPPGPLWKRPLCVYSTLA